MTYEDLKYHIERCRSYNSASQKIIYRHFYNYGMTVCSRYSKNEEEAKEMMNDAFVKVFTKLEKYNNTLSFKAWINKILVNTAIDYFRKNKTVPQTVDLIHAQFVETSEGIIDELSAKELLKLVQKLTPAYRMVFSLYVIEGFKHAEIAQQLGISLGTSKSNLAKARMKLKTLIRSMGDKKSKYG